MNHISYWLVRALVLRDGEEKSGDTSRIGSAPRNAGEGGTLAGKLVFNVANPAVPSLPILITVEGVPTVLGVSKTGEEKEA